MTTLQEAPAVMARDIASMHEEIQAMLTDQRRMATERDVAVAGAVERGVAVADLAECLGVTPGRIYHMKAAGLTRRGEKRNDSDVVEGATAH